MTTKHPTAISLKSADYIAYPECLNKNQHEFEPLLEHLAITPMSAYHYDCNVEWRLPERTLPNCYWSLIIAGDGELMLNSDKFKVKAGQLLLFPARAEHALIPIAGSCMAMINIHFQARVYNLIDICGLIGLSGVFDDKTGNFTRISRECAKIYALKPPGWKRYLKALIRVQLFDLILNSGKRINPVTPELQKLARVYPALELLENSFTEPELSTQDLATKLNISQVYTRKLFNELFGISPVKFIHSRRIEYACSLLKETEMAIKTIAAQSGFNDLAFFYRIFTRTINLTPAQYRKTPQF